MDRRSALITLASPALAGLWKHAAAAAPEMRITRIDTVYWESRDDAPFWPHWTWVRLHTDTGLIGLGETYPRNPTEAALVHTDVAKRLLGKESNRIAVAQDGLAVDLGFQARHDLEQRGFSRAV